MTCMSVWVKATFGWKLHSECVGCANKIKLNQPVDGKTKAPPLFTITCPKRKETK